MMAMSDYIQGYRGRVKDSEVRRKFPEITQAEVPIWTSGPTMISMADKYILAVVVMLIHVFFFIGSDIESPDSQVLPPHVIFFFRIVETTGVLGFVITMLLLAKINHFANFSTSGRWTTAWLLTNTMVPLSWKLMDLIEWLSNRFGSNFSDPLPVWNHAWFLQLGIMSFAIMVIFTILYQRSFRYAITNRRVHIRKSLLYFDTSVHGIAFHKIENLKADPSILGRVFGFGNLHIVTGSGVGLQTEGRDMTTGVANNIPNNVSTGVMKLIHMIFGLVTWKRNRTVMASDPAVCLYGIKRPMRIYRLVNEMIDKSGDSSALGENTEYSV